MQVFNNVGGKTMLLLFILVKLIGGLLLLSYPLGLYLLLREFFKPKAMWLSVKVEVTFMMIFVGAAIHTLIIFPDQISVIKAAFIAIPALLVVMWIEQKKEILFDTSASILGWSIFGTGLTTLYFNSDVNIYTSCIAIAYGLSFIIASHLRSKRLSLNCNDL